jgi:ABC-type lipoprotein release transport system permease subunit
MRPKQSLKSLLRTPFKTILTFLLVAAASFALFSRVTDYAVTSREVAQAASFYRGVAALDTFVPNTVIESQGNATVGVVQTILNENKPWPAIEYIEAFSSLPGVTLADTRYMTAGIVEDYMRLDVDFFDFIIEGFYIGYSSNSPDTLFINIEEPTLLAGGFTIDSGKLFQLRNFTFINALYNQAFFDNLTTGSKCLIVGMRSRTNPQNTSLTSFVILDGQPENYLDTEEFTYYRELIKTIEHDLHVFDIVYTSDMRAIPRFNERTSVIHEGRGLTPEDTNACVVSLHFMNTNKHNIGDIITVELGNKLYPQQWRRGALAVNPENKSNFVKTVELEIVGVFGDVDTDAMRDREPQWSYSRNTIFVPSVLIPIEIPANHETGMGEFSVFIENAADLEAFYEAAVPLATEMNVALRFSDGGWLNIKDSLETSSRTALLTTVLYIGGAALALLLMVYLYIGRNKKTYAIMRALGVPRAKARNSLALPLVVLSALAVPAGGIAGLIYTSNTAAEALETMMATAPVDYTVNTLLPVNIVLLCLLGELAFIIFLSVLFLWKMGKTPPLALLQGDVIRAGVSPAPTPHIADRATFITASNKKLTSALPQKYKYSATGFVVAYIFRHIRRVVWKTAISLTLAFVLTGAVGLLILTNLTYQDAFNTVKVKGAATDFASSSIITLSNSDLTEDFYYYGGFNVLINGFDFNIPITITNDIERYLNSDYETEYILSSDAMCLLGSGIAEMFGINPGDEITLLSQTRHRALTVIHEDEDAISVAAEWESVTFTVAGIIENNFGIYASVSRTTESVYGQPFPLEYSEFMLTDNEKLDNLNSLLGGQMNHNRTYAPMAAFYVDSAELDSIRRVRDLLIMLFPIALAGAVLIGLTAPGLIIIQSAKEAAILRVLGVTKKRVRCMLMFEQIGLCVVGIALATGGLVLYNSGLFSRSAETLAVCGVLYLFGCVCAAFGASVSVTRCRILKLLQVKE